MTLLSRSAADPPWCTRRQAERRGWRIHDGATLRKIYFYGFVPRHGKDGAITGVAPVWRNAEVFHASDVDGIPPAGDAPPSIGAAVEPKDADAVRLLGNVDRRGGMIAAMTAHSKGHGSNGIRLNIEGYKVLHFPLCHPALPNGYPGDYDNLNEVLKTI